MRLFSLLILVLFNISLSYSQGVTKNGSVASSGSDFVTSYGKIVNITALNRNGQILTTPVITTSAATNIGGVNATCGGTISSDGGTPVIGRGVCWSTSPNPTISGNKTIDGVGSGSFTSSITSLTENTVYYIRAYATNSIGTSYGNEIIINSGYSFGSTQFGGLVFYNDGNGHGAVCVPADQSTGAVWGCAGTVIAGADGTAVGTGNQNTIDILNSCTFPGIAAKICYDLVLYGYDDWFLPSEQETYYMYLNLFMSGLGNFAAGSWYWTSTAYQPYNVFAYAYNFTASYGYSTALGRTYGFRVRAARYF